MLSPRQFIRETGFRPSKVLGQNFLVHKDSAIKILKWAGAKPKDTILEIGPGLGALTEALAEHGCNVIAVEKDDRLFQNLKTLWEKEPWLEIHHADALELDVKKLTRQGGRLKVISNLPYSVSTPILERLMENLPRITDMTLLLQEEMVDRICADPGSKQYGRLSIWIQTRCSTERGPRIPKGSFFPVPDVESRLVRLTPRTSPLFPESEIEPFLAFVSKLFQHRRKTIRHTLKSISSATLADETLGQKRAEDLSPQELFSLFKGSS